MPLSKSTMRKRQQVSRGLRLPVMEHGDCWHSEPISLLTVIAEEHLASFASAHQEIEKEPGVSLNPDPVTCGGAAVA